jgi:hypothetical protein
MPGQIGDADRAQVYAALMRAVQSGATVIIADLTRTDLYGYSAVETLVSVQARAAEAGARLKVAAAAGEALLIGQIAGAGHQLDFYPDLTAALAGPRSRGPACVRTDTGYRRRVIPDAAARRSAGKLSRRLSAAPPPGQAPPPGPSYPA